MIIYKINLLLLTSSHLFSFLPKLGFLPFWTSHFARYEILQLFIVAGKVFPQNKQIPQNASKSIQHHGQRAVPFPTKLGICCIFLYRIFHFYTLCILFSSLLAKKNPLSALPAKLFPETSKKCQNKKDAHAVISALSSGASNRVALHSSAL